MKYLKLKKKINSQKYFFSYSCLLVRIDFEEIILEEIKDTSNALLLKI